MIEAMTRIINSKDKACKNRPRVDPGRLNGCGVYADRSDGYSCWKNASRIASPIVGCGKTIFFSSGMDSR